MTRNHTLDRVSKDDAALLMIDHQSGIMQLVHDYTPAEFRSNVLALARTGRGFGLPTVIISSHESGPNGPLTPEPVALLPDTPAIRRPGQISARDNPEFVAAVAATGAVFHEHLPNCGMPIDTHAHAAKGGAS